MCLEAKYFFTCNIISFGVFPTIMVNNSSFFSLCGSFFIEYTFLAYLYITSMTVL